MYEKILLPTDNSEPSQRAGEYAISSANVSGAEIIVLHVIDTHYLNSLPQEDLREQLEKQLREEGEEAVEKFKKKIKDQKCDGNCKNIKITTLIKEGKPDDIIIKTAEKLGVDNIVMGKSGKHGLEKFIVGSTTERVLRGSKVPVSVID
jgi:nucleotide-binding universal stress UspA family protein